MARKEREYWFSIWKSSTNMKVYCSTLRDRMEQGFDYVGNPITDETIEHLEKELEIIEDVLLMGQDGPAARLKYSVFDVVRRANERGKSIRASELERQGKYQEAYEVRAS